MSYTYAYLTATGVFLIAWAAVFCLMPHNRPAILGTGIILGLSGPVAEYWLIPGYWSPDYIVPLSFRRWHFGLEDFLMSFAMAGISAGVFESVILKRGFPPLPALKWIFVLRILPFCVLGFLVMVLLASVFKLTPIHTLLSIVLFSSLLILIRRPNMIPAVLPAALIAGVLFWLFYLALMLPLFPGWIEARWNLANTLVIIAGVPVEEMLWAFTTMLFAGPVYRFCSTTTFRRMYFPFR